MNMSDKLQGKNALFFNYILYIKKIYLGSK